MESKTHYFLEKRFREKNTGDTCQMAGDGARLA